MAILYSHELLGTDESVKSFTRLDLLRFYQRMVLPASSVLAVYADIDRGKVASRILAKLAGWKAGAAVLPNLPDELNCLKAADVETLGDLVSYNKADLLKFRNFGKKSLTELEELVRSKNLTFGMNVGKYLAK